jgi:regulator of replication initiation timing
LFDNPLNNTKKRIIFLVKSFCFCTFVPVKEQVNDIFQTIQPLIKELQLVRESNEAQYNLICQLNRNCEAQLKENRALRKENAELLERLLKYEQPPKDSNNSSTPPAKENMKSEVKRRTKSLREKSDRPVGGQKGHEGHTRDMTETADEVIEHASNYCTQCGLDLSDVEPVTEYITQEIDIPPLHAPT